MLSLNIFVVVFVLLMVYWWSEQGVFSALIHLLVTAVAGVAAIALWETLAVGWLLDRMPEYAWGTSLLVIFCAALFGGRYATDKLVPENLSFHNLADRIGGAIFGLGSGVLTAGLLVIGLQMTGMPEFFNYQPWDLDDNQQPTREQSLWVPVDTLAGDFFTNVANGSMAPLTAPPPERYYRNFEVEAALYNRPSFADSRRSLRPANLGPVADEPLYMLDQLPRSLRDIPAVAIEDNERLVVTATEILMQAEDGPGAGDGDGIFRAGAHQIVLAYDMPGNEPGGFAHPVGLIQRGQFGSLLAGTYATSGTGDRARHHWVFRVPVDAEPQFVRIKHARVAVPDEVVEQPSAVERMIVHREPAGAGGDQEEQESRPSGPSGPSGPPGGPGGPSGPSGPPTGGGSQQQDDDQLAFVSSELPRAMSRNDLQRQNVEMSENAIVSGEATNVTSGGYIGPNLIIDEINHPNNARIVQVRLGTRESSSLLGRIISTATAATQAPVLVDQYDTRYFAIGYFITSGNNTRFRVDASRVIRAVDELDLGRVSEEEEVILFYQVETGARITELVMGDETQELDLEVPSN